MSDGLNKDRLYTRDEMLEARRRIAALEAENEALRRILWLNHGHAGLYGDDGEMQCGICIVDFKRQKPAAIEVALNAHTEYVNALTARAEQAERELAKERALKNKLLEALEDLNNVLRIEQPYMEYDASGELEAARAAIDQARKARPCSP